MLRIVSDDLPFCLGCNLGGDWVCRLPGATPKEVVHAVDKVLKFILRVHAAAVDGQVSLAVLQ
jgi:hypothetical protein